MLDKLQGMRGGAGGSAQPFKPAKVTEAARERAANDPRGAQFQKQSQKQGVMSFKTVSMISKALHPDSKPSDHDRAEAFKAFSGWKADRNAAER